MGNLFSKQRAIEIKNVISVGYLIKFPHLKIRGQIIIKKDYTTSIPEIDLRFENYFPALVRVWPCDFDARNISPAESCH